MLSNFIRVCFLFLISSFLISCNISEKFFPQPRDKEGLADRILYKTIEAIEKEKSLHLAGLGKATKNNIHMLALSFFYYDLLTIEKARELVVYAMQKLLSEIDLETLIHPYLCKYPFPITEAQIRIFAKNADGSAVSSESISIVSLIDGIVEYDIVDFQTGGLKTSDQETYQEALENLSHRECSSDAYKNNLRKNQDFDKNSSQNFHITHKQCKSYISGFQTIFGNKMEKELGLKWIERDFLYRFCGDSIEFYAYRRATLEEARWLELLVLNRLVEEIRADPKMLFCLNLLSLTPESISVDICFVKLSGFRHQDGSIDTVKYSQNREQERYLQYSVTNPFNGHLSYYYNLDNMNGLDDKDESFKTSYKESFQEAVILSAITPIINPAVHDSKAFENELNQILASFEKDMEKRFDLYFEPSGWMISGKPVLPISEIRATCTYFYPVDCEEARRLMLLAAEKLLAALNNSEILRPYLKNYPFSASNFKLRMLFKKKNWLSSSDPYYDESMESVVLSGGVLTYYYYSDKDSTSYNRVIYTKESYTEAQKNCKNTELCLFQKIVNKIKKIYNETIYFLKAAFFMIFLFFLFFLQA